MTIIYHNDIIQGTDEWLQARCGLLTASKMADIITAKTLKFAENQSCRNLIDHIAIQRITKYIEPEFQSYDMQRGQVEEKLARKLYAEHYAPVDVCGLVTNDDMGFTLGWSPDGLIGDDGCIEVKSRVHKYQFATIRAGVMPDDFRIQVQSGMMISNRQWCDFISYSGALNMMTLRVYPEPDLQDALKEAAAEFEKRVCAAIEEYGNKLDSLRIIKTDPTPQEGEIIL